MKEHMPRLLLAELHCIGVTCLFIASKMQDVKPLVLNIVISKIGHNQISKKNITDMEQLILATLEFKVSPVTVFDMLANLPLSLSSRERSKTVWMLRACQFQVKFGEIRPSILAHSCAIASSYESKALATENSTKKDNSVLSQTVKKVKKHIDSFRYLYPTLRCLQRYYGELN